MSGPRCSLDVFFVGSHLNGSPRLPPLGWGIHFLRYEERLYGAGLPDACAGS
jgi:hypothetical protein